MDLATILKEGYQSLGQRTLKLYEELTPYLKSQNTQVQEEFNFFKKNLLAIKYTGNIKIIGKMGVQNLYNMASLIEEAIPPSWKPKDPTTALAFATAATRAYFNISSLEDLFQKTQITSIEIGQDFAGIAHLESKGKEPKKIFFAKYNPVAPALSAIENIHEFYHCLQPERHKIMQILKEAQDIPQFTQFMDAVNDDPHLREEWIRITQSSHQLNFFTQPKIRELASTLGMERRHFDAYIDENRARLNYLGSYEEGDAYLMQTAILQAAPDMHNNEKIQKIYALLSLTDTLLAPFQQPKQTMYFLGIGIAEYLLNHPEEKERLDNSKEFHEELTREMVFVGK